MLVGQNLSISIVIKHEEVRPPKDNDGEARIQAKVDRDAQVLRPSRDMSKRCRRPVEGAHQGSHLATTDEGLRLSSTLLHRRPVLPPPLHRYVLVEIVNNSTDVVGFREMRYRDFSFFREFTREHIREILVQIRRVSRDRRYSKRRVFLILATCTCGRCHTGFT